jgi:hypothetical protein
MSEIANCLRKWSYFARSFYFIFKSAIASKDHILINADFLALTQGLHGSEGRFRHTEKLLIWDGRLAAGTDGIGKSNPFVYPTFIQGSF